LRPLAVATGLLKHHALVDRTGHGGAKSLKGFKPALTQGVEIAAPDEQPAPRQHTGPKSLGHVDGRPLLRLEAKGLRSLPEAATIHRNPRNRQPHEAPSTHARILSVSGTRNARQLYTRQSNDRPL